MLAKAPGATALCVVSIALAIGLTTGLFGIADAVYMRPFPFERPGEILRAKSIGDDGQEFYYDWADYEDVARATKGQAEICAYRRMGAILGGDVNEVVLYNPATSNYFRFLGVRAALGQASFDTVDGRPAAVLGWHLWQRRFGGDPGIVGKTIILDRKALVVAGVMPRDFTGAVRGFPFDVWVSTDTLFDVIGDRYDKQERSGDWEIIARPKPGVSPRRLAAQLDASIRGAGKHKPAPKGAVSTILEAPFALNWRQRLVAGGAMLAVLGLLLFVGCANAAQVRAAHAEARKRELAVRRALGAGTWRMARLLLAETALIAAAGAGLGVLLARFLMDVASTYSAVAGGMLDGGFIDLGIRLDHRVLLVTLAATLLSIMLAGLAPIRHAVRLDVNQVLKSEQGLTGPRREWRKKLLVAGQIAASVLFFGMAAQFVRSAKNAADVRPGFDPSKKLFVMTVLPGWNWPRTAWCEQACERLSRLPGVRGATFARRLPLSGSGGGMKARVEIPGEAPLGVRLNNVGGNYFSLMGTRVLAGRGIGPNDREGSPLVTVVSQLLAKQVFQGRYPIGQWISIDGKIRQVVGVAEDGPMGDYLHEEIAPYLYLPYAQAPRGDLALMVETAGEPEAFEQAIRKELKRFDPGLVVDSATTLRHHMDAALIYDHVLASTATALGVFGFLLTGAGLFGVIQFAVSRRTREIGLRVALGARPAEIHKMMLEESLKMAAWGIPIGLLLVGAAAHITQSLLIGVTALDPLTYASSAALALVLALLAAWLPAARAARVDPMTALRAE
jgi:predicted permease